MKREKTEDGSNVLEEIKFGNMYFKKSMSDGLK